MTCDSRSIHTRLAWGLVALTAVGCAQPPYDVAPVSGQITLDGEPLDNASVRFQPQQGPSSNALVGPGSIGQTDANGRFELMSYKGDAGAVVGEHKVSVSTYADELVDPENSDKMRVTSEERIPRRYRAPTELTFIVPASGSTDANFDLFTN